jgi:hypothetical protein
MESILRDDDIIVHIVSTETSPKPVYPLGIEYMPEVTIELLSSVEIVEDISEPIVFIDSDTLSIWNLDELR